MCILGLKKGEMMVPALQDVALIRFKEKVVLKRGKPIYLRDLCYLYVPQHTRERLQQMVIYHPQERDGNYLVIDILWVLQKLQEVVPQLEIEYVGANRIIVEMEVKRRRMQPLFVVLVWLLLFFGSGMAIMNFHTDVSMHQVHQKLYHLIMGEKEARPLLIQIPYSIGIGVGMILFFNHLFRKRINDEPSPLEVEMFLYDQNVKQYLAVHEKPVNKRENPQ